MTKPCITCEELLPVENFDKHSGMTDGHINVCKTCRHDYCKQWRAKNRAEQKIKKSIYHEQHKARINHKRVIDRKANPAKYQESNLLHNFGITLEQYNTMLESQNGVCAICSKPETAQYKTRQTRNLAVDHCHATGTIRGLLCGKCNKGIGLFMENLDSLNSAITYIKKHERVGN